ncbi:TetR family transcriptional regulator [Agrobacterium tumefaciens]|uniref:Transcriptional regulator, TetR family n=2 Tax=Agrobacterium tumefaciens complex TaxID=1183400 RepID=Q7CWT2_AGRFC|nr:TetR family transcriptional regulator AmeR [Agrobacterium fabrum]AAG09744.1 TetR family bacterial regulatory protein [Agrobacterium tumefaciens]AAK88274.1 transcriptional regulator, TetR family [Agrobacterium fabrum str. C58]AYM58241.1 TetR family transcriptional regulator [Agrobacterium fabrum]KEY52283.1 TetR family transcriptional regulator [Agrobacterium tumefaciens]KJX87204.1 HTH-type transcriptional regulator uidR [Agrobacterium tumefaciens]
MNKTIDQVRKGDRKSDLPVRRRPRRSAEETRRDILAKAEELFRERGFNAVAIADIASALNMSPANVFKHFSSKNALVDAIGFGQIGVFERQICPLDKSHAPLDRLRHLARNLMEQHHQDLNKNPYVFEMILMTAKQDMKCGDYYKSVIAKLLAEIIRDGVEAGLYIATDIPVLAETVLHALTSVIHPVLIAQEDIGNLATRCDQLVDLIDAGLRNPLAK